MTFKIESKDIQLVDTSKLVLNPKNMNSHPKDQVERLQKLIEFNGFRNPVIVSNRTGFVVAGHGRIEAAKNMGMSLVPVMYQDFENEAQEYAYMVSDNAIASWSELDLSAVNAEMLDLGPDFDIDMLGIKDFELDISETDDVYTRKIESPIYEPSGENPSVSMLYDIEKTSVLLKEVEESRLPIEIKSFLNISAYRHVKFNYRNIAEYYAHASPEAQNLMEKSALVIIDFEKAIEFGFAKLSKDLLSLSADEVDE